MNSQFVPSLSSKAEKIFPEKSALDAVNQVEELHAQVNGDIFMQVEDTEGLAAQRAEVNKAELLAADFATISSLARHAKFDDVEQMLASPDWNVPIDYQDENGNTLFHIATQNGSKRLAKLCIRRGEYFMCCSCMCVMILITMIIEYILILTTFYKPLLHTTTTTTTTTITIGCNMNMVNLNGQTALHFAFGYGFNELGEYLKDKGCHDDILNVDGLTPYEGLGAAELSLL